MSKVHYVSSEKREKENISMSSSFISNHYREPLSNFFLLDRTLGNSTYIFPKYYEKDQNIPMWFSDELSNIIDKLR